MEAAEIASFVDQDALSRIKRVDATPLIRVYSIGHEGEANLNFPWIGQRTLKWAQAAVEWIRDKLDIGTPVFDRHTSPTNSTENRETLGEVIGRTTRKIGDKLNTLAAVYIRPQFRDKELDVASFEAEMYYDHDGVEAWPTGIDRITGIALSNSGIDRPGFPGATLLGAVQAFVQAQGFAEGKGSMGTLADLKKLVEELKPNPSDLFTKDVLVADKTVVEHLKVEKHDLWNQATRLENEKGELQNKIAKLGETHAEEVKTLRQQNVKAQVQPLFENLATERKLPEQQKKFIVKNLTQFTPTKDTPDEVKAELNTFIDNQQKVYQEIAKDVFGIADTGQNQQQQGGQQGKQQQQQQGQQKVVDDDVDAAVDPNVNPLIPGGKADKEFKSQ